jgi:hypothetical protein
VVKLPNCERAIVAREKITDYLLSLTHEDGKGKAAYFIRRGFASERWEALSAALREHACAHDVAGVATNEHGTRYRIEGTLMTPDGRQPFIRSIWITEQGVAEPKFVTAYPIRRPAQ